MQSSFSLSLEPGLERGVPWGRDLYTFVTSAAGHMMRTLEKPRKNRPSKRQVNHRRFLHNMIQRKFADIEASNHRLSSMLCFKGDENVQDTSDPALNPSQIDPSAEEPTPDGEASPKSSTIDSQNLEIGRKTQPESTRKPRLKSKKSKHKKSEQKPVEFTSIEWMPLEMMHFFEEEEQEQSSLQQLDMDTSLSFLPELSPLSLDSCDFSVQMFTDISSCTPTHEDIVEDIMESEWAEMIELFNGSNRCADVEDYLENICNFYSDVDKDEEQEDFYSERVQCLYDAGQASAADQVEHNEPFLMSDIMDNFQNDLPSCMSHQCMYQHPDVQQSQNEQCELSPVLFEGVAQSFSTPSQHVPRFSIPTPPHEGDWMFSDIQTENTALLY